MELKHYLAALLKWWWLVVIATLLAAGVSYWTTNRLPRLYLANTTMMVGRFTQAADPTANDFYTSQQLAQTYVQLARRQPILQATADALGLAMPWSALAGQVNAWVVPQTQLMQISVADTDPERAAAIADEIAHQLILQSPTTSDREQAQQREFVNQQINDLKAKIETAKRQIETLDKRLALETSARSIQDLHTQIGAQQQNLMNWQANYANLLNFFKGNQTNYLSVVDSAVIPDEPFSPNTRYNVMLAALIGGLLAVAAAILLEFLDDTVKSPEDVQRLTKLPTLGVITRLHDVKTPTDTLVAVNTPRSMSAEAYRVLRTNVQFTSLGQAEPRLLVTSAAPSEGKTVTAANLAATMAQAGRSVILIDTDLRRPSIHKVFGVPNRIGVTNLLLDPTLSVESVLVDTEVPDLRVLPSGPLPPNPAELLASQVMQTRLAEAQALADVVILDSPPVLVVADAAILGGSATEIILVVNAARTRSVTVKRAKDTLDQMGLHTVGVVLNNMPSRRGAGGYNYGGYYGYYYAQTGDGKDRSRGSSGASVEQTKRKPSDASSAAD